MARLTTLTDLTGTVTRQSLFNAWSDASFPVVQKGEFAPTFASIEIGTTFSDSPDPADPGQLFWHQQDQLMYVYTDVLDNTGVSLWLAFGPDSFECAALTAEPIPAGAVVEAWFDRYVKTGNPESNPLNEGGNSPIYIGVNQSGLPDPSEPWPGNTAASGTWIRVGIDGYVRGWFPKEDTNVSETHFGGSTTVAGDWLGVLSGVQQRFRGGVGNRATAALGTTHQVGQAVWAVTTSSGFSATYARFRWLGGYVSRSEP